MDKDNWGFPYSMSDQFHSQFNHPIRIHRSWLGQMTLIFTAYCATYVIVVLSASKAKNSNVIL